MGYGEKKYEEQKQDTTKTYVNIAKKKKSMREVAGLLNN